MASVPTSPGVDRGALATRLRLAKLPALDGLRAIAVLLVIVYHFGIPGVPGAYGVVVFFVLSGFLITWLLLREIDRTGTISFRGFYLRRSLRIFPAFYAYWLLLTAILLLTHRPVLWPHAWSAFFYVSNYYHAFFGDPSTGFSHTWSLAIEEQFYLLWPPLLLLLRRSRFGVARPLMAIIVCLWLYRAVACYLFEVNQAYVYAAFDMRCDALLVGCLLAVLLAAPGATHGHAAARWARLTESPSLALVTTAALVVVALGRVSGIPRYRDVVAFTLIPPLVALLIAQLIAVSDTPMWRWVESAPMRFLGRLSYSLYLYQQVTLEPVRKLLRQTPVGVQLAGAIALTVVVAAGSYYVVERPFLRLKERTAQQPAL